jgi:hypothetical protein
MGDFAAFCVKVETRQNFLMAHAPRCEKCDTFQVQIIRTEAPAVWKCRICKHRFGFEPPTSLKERCDDP